MILLKVEKQSVIPSDCLLAIQPGDNVHLDHVGIQSGPLSSLRFSHSENVHLTHGTASRLWITPISKGAIRGSFLWSSTQWTATGTSNDYLWRKMTSSCYIYGFIDLGYGMISYSVR